MDADRLIALRLSLPMGVSPIPQHEDGRTDVPVLVLSPGIIPEPTWVQALWDNHLDHGVPVGARLANAGGRLLHAGADADGRPIGAGAPAGNSLFAAARLDLALLPPFIASADAIRQGPIRGLLVSDATAVTLEDGDPGSDAPASSWLHDALLVLDEAPPGEKAVAKLVALRAAGFTPILRWAHGDADPAAVRDLRGAGVITINPHEATPAGLAGALRPKVVVHLTESSMGTEQPVISATHPAALHLLAAPSQDRTLAQRADRIEDGPDEALLAAVVEMAGRQDRQTTIEPTIVAPQPTVAGMVSVVIPVWNNWNLTERCLESLADHHEAPLEIIVVDNGSTDSTARELADRPGVRVITNAENLGFPAAGNQGIAAATGEFVCILNNDTEVVAGWLVEMMAALQVPDTGMVGPRSNRISGLQGVPETPGLDEPRDAHRWARAWAAARRGSS